MCEQKLSVFSADYWRAARRELNNPRVLAFSGLVCAMAIVLESLPIYLLGPSLKIYFSFLAVSLGCMCYGPVVGMMAGAIIDTVGFLLAGYGEPYFPGYLITAMLSGLIYGVMLYRQKPTLPRIIVYAASSSTTAATSCWAVSGKRCSTARATFTISPRVW